MNPLRPTFRLLSLGVILCAAACSAPEAVEKLPSVFYPDAPAAPRIQFLRSITVGSDIEEGRSGLDTLLFGEVEMEKTLMAPYGVTLHDGIFYVCDIQQSAVVTIDLEGKEMYLVEFEGRGVVQKPVNLTFSEDGRMFVADMGRRQLVVYDEDFKFIKEIGPFDQDEVESRVVDVEVANGLIYFLDAGIGQVRVFDLDTYEEKMVFGSEDDQGKKLVKPTNLTIDAEGNSYVVDTVQCQIFVWDKDGKFVRTIGSPGDIVGQFARPKGIALDDDILYVIDSSFENCQLFNMDGDPLMFFANAGVGPGNLYLPTCVWIGDEGLDLFDDYIDSDFQAEKLIAITNNYGPFKLNFYALGKADGYEYADNEAARGLAELQPETEE